MPYPPDAGDLHRLFTYATPLGPHVVEPELGTAALNQIYVQDVTPYDPDSPPQTSTYIMGRRGAGKTMLLLSAPGRPPGDTVNLYKSDVLAGMRDLFASVFDELHFTLTLDNCADIWQAAFEVALAAQLFHEPVDSAFVAERLQIGQFVRGLKASAKLRAIDPNSIVRAFADFLKDQARLSIRGPVLSWLNGLNINNVSVGLLRSHVVRILRGERRTLTVLIDSLEELTTRFSHYEPVLKPLFRYLGRQGLLGISAPPFHVRCCLPTEVYEKLVTASENPGKDFVNMCTIRWTVGDLEQLIVRRLYILADILAEQGDAMLRQHLANAPKEPRTVIESLLPITVINNCGITENTFPYIVRHTQLLPRQLLILFNHLLKGKPTIAIVAEGNRLDARRVRHAVADAEPRLAMEVVNAHLANWPGAPQALAALIPSLPHRFDRTFLEQQYDALGLRKYSGRFSDLLSALIKLGVVGRIRRETTEYLIGEFAYLFPSGMTTSADDEFCLHPMFSRYQGRSSGRHKPIYPGPVSMPDDVFSDHEMYY